MYPAILCSIPSLPYLPSTAYIQHIAILLSLIPDRVNLGSANIQPSTCQSSIIIIKLFPSSPLRTYHCSSGGAVSGSWLALYPWKWKTGGRKGFIFGLSISFYYFFKLFQTMIIPQSANRSNQIVSYHIYPQPDRREFASPFLLPSTFPFIYFV